MIKVGGKSFNNGIEFYSRKYKVNFKNHGDTTKILLLKNESKQKTKILDKLYTFPIIRGLISIFNLHPFYPIIILNEILINITDSQNNNFTISNSITILPFITLIFVIFFIIKTILLNIKDTLKYHGAEHKIILTNYQNKEINFENCKKASRIADNCGTMYIALFLTILILELILNSVFNFNMYFSIKLLITHLIAYELFMLDSNTPIINIIFKLGYMFQNYVVTSEPTNMQLKRAIEAFKILEKAENDKFTENEIQDLLNNGKTLNF